MAKMLQVKLRRGAGTSREAGAFTCTVILVPFSTTSSSVRPPSSCGLSAAQARRLAIGAQGLGGVASLAKVMERVGTIQLDAVNVLARTQFIVPFSRAGAYDTSRLVEMSGPAKPWFEYWGHAASLLPVDMQPLLRWRMQDARNDVGDDGRPRSQRRQWRLAHGDYLARVLHEVRDRGPLAASELSDPRRQNGEWWDRRSFGRRALEVLFADGILAAWRRPNFERVYDLAERVLPARVLDAPAPTSAEAKKRLLEVAAGCLGVATVGDMADYFWLRPAQARPLVAELAGEGRLQEVSVEGWAQPAYVLPGTRSPRRPLRNALLSPFDSLIWCRPRTERLFSTRYRIEIYVPAPQRVHGYYVLPLLAGDRIVARLDLKSDRKASALLVKAAHKEGLVPETEVAVAELTRLAAWLGLERVVFGGRGDLVLPKQWTANSLAP